MSRIFYFLVLLSLTACVDNNDDCNCDQFGHSYNGVRDSLGLVQIPSNFQLTSMTEWNSDYYCKWTDSSQLTTNVVMHKTVHVLKDKNRIEWDKTTYIFPDLADCVIDPDSGPEDRNPTVSYLYSFNDSIVYHSSICFDIYDTLDIDDFGNGGQRLLRIFQLRNLDSRYYPPDLIELR